MAVKENVIKNNNFYINKIYLFPINKYIKISRTIMY